MIGIVDYGMGNIKSIKKAVEHIGFEAIVTNNIDELEKCSRLIIPGVGAFKKAIENMKAYGVYEYIKQYDKPLLGICLGMQLLFDKGFEDGETDGLGLIPGEVILIEASVKVPHMGWNKVNGSYYYFVHSYYAKCDVEYVSGYANYGVRIPAIVRKGNVIGCQFHPEKSGEDGLKILKWFGGLK